MPTSGNLMLLLLLMMAHASGKEQIFRFVFSAYKNFNLVVIFVEKRRISLAVLARAQKNEEGKSFD